jgi:hypothetical protein
MNMSKAITSIKMSLGLYAITLPFKDETTGDLTPTENVIRDVLVNVTIPTYSQFVPWVKTLDASVSNLKAIDKRAGVFMLPQMLCTTPILYVSSIKFPKYSGRGDVYGDVFTVGYSSVFGGISRGAQDVATATASSFLSSQMKAEPTWEYLGENKIKLYGFPRTTLSFTVAAEHEPNGETIEPSCYDSFMQLAMLDTKMFLYNTMKLYDGMSSAFGSINLKIDEYQAADSERTALLKEWGETFHLDMSWEQFM